MVHGRLSENEKMALEELKRSVAERYRLIDFGVFGSKARGDASPHSNIDVMLELEEYTPATESSIDDIAWLAPGLPPAFRCCQPI